MTKNSPTVSEEMAIVAPVVVVGSESYPFGGGRGGGKAQKTSLWLSFPVIYHWHG